MVNIYKLKLTVLQQEILRFLFMKSDKSFNARGLSIALEVSHPAISKALPLLEKQGYITVEKDKDSKRLSIRLKRDEPLVAGMKRADNLRTLYESGLADFLEKELAGATIILFGSYSRGEDTTSSDVDIAVIGRKEKRMELGGYEKILERRINLNFYDSLKGVHKNLRENLCNGIVIAGSVEL